jgi:hypothetical protein
MRSSLLVCLVFLFHALPAQTTSPENVCDLFLSAINVQKGDKVNWTKLQELFIEDAKFRLVAEGRLQSLNFQEFREKSRYEAMGFREKALERKLTVFGNLASVVEQFEAEISSQGIQFQGINMYHLVKVGDAWKITEVIYQLASEELPLPTDW